MPRSKLDTLILRIAAFFREHAGRYSLDPERIEVRYILNWGGFVNATFFVKDGRTTYHLKLADDPESQVSLRRWQHFSERLQQQYHAPRMLDWVKIPRTRFAGPIFEYIPGRAADYSARPEVFSGVLELVAHLHADGDLAAGLEALDGPPSTCADYFISVYIDRFDEDLLSVAGDLPPFVSLDLLSWMMGETRELEGIARDDPAFQLPASSPTHGDLWANNVLVTQDGRWYVIDWDDLALGDPALEYGIILGPQWRAGKMTAEEAAALLPSNDPALRRRFEICLRALLLDEVIDSLADWVESNFAPDHQAEVRQVKESVHRSALARYQELYGNFSHHTASGNDRLS